MDIMDFSVQRTFSLMNISIVSVNKGGYDMFGSFFVFFAPGYQFYLNIHGTTGRKQKFSSQSPHPGAPV